jgi:hypothetical protein
MMVRIAAGYDRLAKCADDTASLDKSPGSQPDTLAREAPDTLASEKKP